MAIERWRPFVSVERWDPFRNMTDIQGEVNRLFDSFLGRPTTSANGSAVRSWAPVLDMRETKDDVVLTFELPGISEKDVSLSITGDLLTVRGERTFNRDSKDEGVRDYFEIGVLAYGNDVHPALGGALAGRVFVPVSAIADNPMRVEDRVQKVSDGVGGLVELAHRLATIPFSADQELDADAEGLRLSVAAGYDPAA